MNFNLRHQYGIFVAESQKFLHAKRPQLRRARTHWNGCFRRLDTMIFNTFSWPTLKSRQDYLKCMLVFKSLHGLAPAYLLNEFNHMHDFHSYNICQRDLLYLPLAQTIKYQGSSRFSGAKIWNTFPLALRSEHDWNKFGFGLKRHFRSKPNSACNIFAILSCSIFFYLSLFFVLFWYSSRPHSNQPCWAGHPWLNIVQNKIK